MNSLAEFWQQLDTTRDKGYYIHPQDMEKLEPLRDKEIQKLKRELFFYGKDRNAYDVHKDNYKLHVDLLPSPYMGDLENAKIYLYMLNPGYDKRDYADHENDDIRTGLSATIKQEFSGNDYLEQYKFLLLNPKFKETAGGGYYLRYMKRCIETYQAKTNKSYEDAIKDFANNICIVQAMPYHSQQFNGTLRGITRDLPSHTTAKDYLFSISNDPQKLIFIVRGYYFFGRQIPENSNMVPFERGFENIAANFPYNAVYPYKPKYEKEGITHGERLVNHLIKTLN